MNKLAEINPTYVKRNTVEMEKDLHHDPFIPRDITPAPVKPMDKRFRKLISLIEQRIKELPGAVGEDFFPLKHSFSEGLYVREILFPKGMFIVGKLHKGSYFSSMISGDISVLTETGMKRLKGAHPSIAPPKVKRFGYTHEDTVWVTVHPNPDNITDIDKLEDMIHDKEEYYEDDGSCGEILRLFTRNVLLDKYNPKKFRELTKEIYDHEKPGMWSDWTKEQQELFISKDWEAFSRSRGYTEEEISKVKEWVRMKEFAEDHGLNPLVQIQDLTDAVIKRSLTYDKGGEIIKSSMMPESKKRRKMSDNKEVYMNCGLTALSNLSTLKSASMRTLINIAEDNGLKLYPYKVPIDKLSLLPRPAILQAKNHFVYFEDKLEDLEYTGNVLLLKETNYPEIKSGLAGIKGETGVAVAIGGSAILGVGAQAGWFGDGGGGGQHGIDMMMVPDYEDYAGIRSDLIDYYGRAMNREEAPGMEQYYNDLYSEHSRNVNREFLGDPGNRGNSAAGMAMQAGAMGGVGPKAMMSNIGRVGNEAASKKTAFDALLKKLRTENLEKGAWAGAQGMSQLPQGQRYIGGQYSGGGGQQNTGMGDAMQFLGSYMGSQAPGGTPNYNQPWTSGAPGQQPGQAWGGYQSPTTAYSSIRYKKNVRSWN